uniref:Uncharacterized protein n=1 Tax=Myoviridae sp. ct35n35 TaxID=2823534 RepID=A0A8S5LCN8_9CAUD|nr:MAG TPA: hypothetical protein [Myoviridae sp. ct35n35]DAO70544.1 MAG TPA: hypothetical protein [Caudoviricetes sp.]
MCIRYFVSFSGAKLLIFFNTANKLLIFFNIKI